MQRIEELLGLPKHSRSEVGVENWRAGPMFKIAYLSLLAFFLAPASAEEINTLAANTDCDFVSIRQAEKQKDDDTIDWYAFDRKHREYTGRELLPEHQEKEPERDTVIGCLIKNTQSEQPASPVETDDVEVQYMEVSDWAKPAVIVHEEKSDAEEDALVRSQEETEKPKRDIIDYLMNEAPLIVQVTIVLFLAVVAVCLAFGMRIMSRLILGLMQRRKICHIPCSLITTNSHEITGNMTVLGLRSFRFVPKDKAEMAYFKRTLDEPEMFYFSVHVGDISIPVFVDGIRGYYSPVAFDEKLTPKMQKSILELSTITPQIGQLIIVPYNVKKHKIHVMNRANNMIYTSNKKGLGANKLGNSALDKAFGYLGIRFGHSS